MQYAYQIPSSVRRILERGGTRKFRKFENNEDQNENFPSQNQVRFPARNYMKTKKKRSSLKFGPVFGPKLGEDQKKGLRPSFQCSNPLPKLQRGDPCRDFAYHSLLLILSWRPKGGAWPNGPLCKYAPAETRYCILVSLTHFYERLLTCLQHWKDSKQQNIRFIASSLKFFWYGGMERNMEENFGIDRNMEWNIFSIEWKWNARKLPVWNIEKSSSIPYHALLRTQVKYKVNLPVFCLFFTLNTISCFMLGRDVEAEAGSEGGGSA